MIHENNLLPKDRIVLITNRVRGWALIAYAFRDLCFFVLFAFNDYDRVSSVIPFIASDIVFSILLVIGLSSIQFRLPLKHIGQVGLILMLIRPFILLAFDLPLLAPGHYRLQSFLSIPRIPIHYAEPAIYFVPYVGYLLIGWLMIKTEAFPRWTGIVLVLSGLFNLAASYSGIAQTADSLHITLLMSATLTEALAFAGYGRHILNLSSSAE